MISAINQDYPPPNKLVEYDCKTLNFIRSRMSRISYDLVSDANKAAQKYIKGYVLNFESSFEYLLADKSVEVNIGAEIDSEDGKYRKVSYYLLLADGKTKIYRKFHFDYHPDAKDRNHSILHLQYGGALSEKFKGKYSKNDYFPWLKEPRIPFKPMSLALLMHLLFINIEDVEVKKVRDTTEWKNLVRDNESFLWKSYFKNCSDYFNTTGRKLMFDYFCGNH